MIPAHILRVSLDDALEIVATADTARDLGANALADVLAVPEPQRTRLLEVLRRCWELNAEMLAAGQRLTSRLDEMARIAHHAQYDDRPDSLLTVKRLAAMLRPHLTVIADPASDGGPSYLAAVGALKGLIDCTPTDRLTGGGMQRALGPGRHALLMSFVDGHAEPTLSRTRHSAHANPRPGRRAGGGAAGSPILLEASSPAHNLHDQEVAA